MPASAEVLDHVVKVTLTAWADAHPGCDIIDSEVCSCGATVWLVPECPTHAPLAIATWRDDPDVGPVVSFRTGLPRPQVPYEGDA
jgi:hypothetical protein